ncbi:protein-tyrosine phosphatase-like protein [Naematelia encephala]|uniref:Protein-tyrosine phosphatase-like protein n=1 Tax=Naematelia encephala TaxID=71784 RepID=A0A1Y2B0T8_9TREE|nr:protein-tyrosine phosphatase-like protein [Naematelia encephala]
MSTPNLNSAPTGSDQAAVFGHVVKTSSTHPIIISPFFPSELLPLLSQHLIVPPASPVTGRNCLKSTIDVPAMLLSYAPPPGSSSAQSLFASQQASPPRERIAGNLLLSSCPGKRLRMEGPVKGRGPVCRDLKTDLARIKGEGVGAVVCCLDDAELALLGVPWDMYREVASEIGLDIVRLPMPDGFTPVSLSLFDSQVDLLISRYSLQGTDILVHCRGGIGRAGLTACAWAIKMGFVPPHPSLAIVADAAGQGAVLPAELEHQIVMSIVERAIAMIRSRRGLKAIESFEQVQFLASYIKWLRVNTRAI